MLSDDRDDARVMPRCEVTVDDMAKIEKID